MSGVLRTRSGDFIVDESLPFVPAGAGEHLYLRVRKTGQNTRWVARRLARAAGLHARAVGFAGLKDRHAVASQWFSLHLPGRPDPELDELAADGIEILEGVRHIGKLRTGAVAANRFRLTIRDIEGDRAGLRERLAEFGVRPVPNYFGAQRFGHDAGNLLLLQPGRRADRHARRFGLSALRSAIFNGWLAARIADDSWLRAAPGEIAFYPDTGRYGRVDGAGAPAQAVPAGLLWGVGENQACGAAAAAEAAYCDGFPVTRALIESCDVRMLRRPLAMTPIEPQFTLTKTGLELEFALAKGQFATVAIRELGRFFDAPQVRR